MFFETAIIQNLNSKICTLRGGYKLPVFEKVDSMAKNILKPVSAISDQKRKGLRESKKPTTEVSSSVPSLTAFDTSFSREKVKPSSARQTYHLTNMVSHAESLGSLSSPNQSLQGLLLLGSQHDSPPRLAQQKYEIGFDEEEFEALKRIHHSDCVNSHKINDL